MELANAIALLAPRTALIAFTSIARIVSPRTHPKSSVWHQFIKKELNLLLKKSRIFCYRKSLSKAIGKLKNASEAALGGMREAQSSGEDRSARRFARI